jgi:nucleoside-diphosphate-sugar epimerase
MEACHLVDVEKFIFLGSSCIYPRDCAQPIKEEYLLSGPLEETNSAYAIAKIAGVELVKSYQKPCTYDSLPFYYHKLDLLVRDHNYPTNHFQQSLVALFESY